MKIYPTRIIVSLALVVAMSTGIHAQDGKQIIEHYLDTLSGSQIDKWVQIRSFYAESIVYFNTDEFLSPLPSFREKKFDYEKLYRLWPDKTKLELYSDSSFTNLTSEFFFSNKEHFIKIGNIPPITAPVNKHLWFEFYPVLVRNYLSNAEVVEYKGAHTLPGENEWCHQVDIVVNGTTHQLFFNPRNYLLDAIFVIEGNYWLRLSDYQYHDGYLIHTAERSIREGNLLESKKYTKFIFNPDLQNNLFSH